MDITVYEEIEQIKALISILEHYCDELEKTVITRPMGEILEAKRAGLPADYADNYENRCYCHNVSTAQNMINNIKEFHIPYWQAIIDELKKRL